MFYALIWATGPEDRTISSPLEVMMASLARHGGCGSLTVVALDGPDAWFDAVQCLAGAAGAGCSDARSILGALDAEFPNLRRTYGDYESRCFLRWPALWRLLGDRPFEQVWHIDVDMVFFAGLEELAADTAGKTFILQGCPAFTSISRPDWFQTYECGLRALHDTGEPGFRVTPESRARHRKTDQQLGNASVYQIPLAHDQDMIECLVGEARLPQDAFSIVRGNRFYYMQNPLCLRAWHHLATDDPAAVFEDRDEAMFVGRRRVPFIHFQADATRYFEAYRRAASLGMAGALPHPFSNPEDHASGLSMRYALAARVLIPGRRVNRGAIMRRSIGRERRSGRRLLTSALNHLLGGQP